MNLRFAQQNFLSAIGRRIATALFFCVMFLLFIVTCHPLSTTNHFELMGTSDECCSEHVLEDMNDAHTSPLSQIMIPNAFVLFVATVVNLFIGAAFVPILSISPSTVQQRQRTLAWLWAKPWPFAWSGGYLPNLSSMRAP